MVTFIRKTRSPRKNLKADLNLTLKRFLNIHLIPNE